MYVGAKVVANPKVLEPLFVARFVLGDLGLEGTLQLLVSSPKSFVQEHDDLIHGYGSPLASNVVLVGGGRVVYTESVTEQVDDRALDNALIDRVSDEGGLHLVL